MTFNKIIFGGYLTRDPDLRYTPKGTALCVISIAANRKWTGEDGQSREEVTFLECTAWGNTAELIGQRFKKGRPILIEGRLKLDQWEDKKTGDSRNKLTAIVESFSFVGSKEDGQEERRPAATGRTGFAAQRTPVSAPVGQGSDGPPDDDLDDVPF